MKRKENAEKIFSMYQQSLNTNKKQAQELRMIKKEVDILRTANTTFTDNDLKQLELGSRYFEGGEDNEYRKMIRSLIYRLEVAERIVKIVEKNGDGSLYDECEAWRKACGK